MSEWGDKLPVLEVTHNGIKLKDEFGVITELIYKYIQVGPSLQTDITNLILHTHKNVRELRGIYDCMPVDAYTVVVFGGPNLDREVHSQEFFVSEEKATEMAFPILEKYHPTIKRDEYEIQEQNRDFPVLFMVGDVQIGCLIWNMRVPDGQ